LIFLMASGSGSGIKSSESNTGNNANSGKAIPPDPRRAVRSVSGRQRGLSGSFDRVGEGECVDELFVRFSHDRLPLVEANHRAAISSRSAEGA
jgi:hypothetical protein